MILLLITSLDKISFLPFFHSLVEARRAEGQRFCPFDCRPFPPFSSEARGRLPTANGKSGRVRCREARPPRTPPSGGSPGEGHRGSWLRRL
jgi:hypothetical protein